MAARLRIVAKNLAKSASIVATSEVGNMLASNLKKPSKNSVWRAANKWPTLTLSWGAAVVLSALALPHCNLSPTAQMRVRATTEVSTTNLLPNSDGPVWTSPAFGGVGDAPGFGYFAQSIQFPSTKSVDLYLYRNATIAVGTSATFSCFVKMDDGTAPVVGYSNTTGDFRIVVANSAITSSTLVTIQNLGGGVYRVTGTLASGNGASSNFGIVTYATQSGKAFRVTGYQLEYGTVATSYYPSNDTFTSRSGNATYIGDDGLIKTAATGVARMQYTPFDMAAPPHLLLEDAASNFCRGSATLSTSHSWVYNACTVAAATGKFYRGLQYQRVSKTTTAANESIRSYSLSISAGGTFTTSFALRADTSGTVEFGQYDATAATFGTAAENYASIVEGPGTLTSPAVGIFRVTGLSANEDTIVQCTSFYPTAASGSIYIYPGGRSSVVATDAVLVTRVQMEYGAKYDGPDLVTNGAFTTDLTGWTVTAPTGTSVVWSSGTAAITGDGVSTAYIERTIATVSGRTYTLTFSSTTNSVAVNVGTTSKGAQLATLASSLIGNNTMTFTATGTTTYISFRRGTTGTANLDNVVVKAHALVPFVTSYINTTTATGTRNRDAHTTALGTRPEGYMDTWQNYGVDTGWQTACAAPGITPEGMDDIVGASAYAYGGGNTARAWFPPVAVKGVSVSISDPDNVQGYVEAAMLVVGEYWSPARNPSWGNGLTPIDRSKNTVTEGGTLKSDRRTRSKKLSVNLNNMEEADRSYMADLLLRCGITEPIFFCLFPESDDPKLEQHYTIMGKVSTLSAMTMPYWNAANSPLELEQV